jgi:hypothetical protein
MIAQAHHPWAGRADFPRYVDVLARLYASRGDAPGVAAETGVAMLLYLDQAWKHITRYGRTPTRAELVGAIACGPSTGSDPS